MGSKTKLLADELERGSKGIDGVSGGVSAGEGNVDDARGGGGAEGGKGDDEVFGEADLFILGCHDHRHAQGLGGSVRHVELQGN